MTIHTQAEKEMKGWNALPPELVEQVLAHLENGELLKMMRTCRTAPSICRAALFEAPHRRVEVQSIHGRSALVDGVASAGCMWIGVEVGHAEADKGVDDPTRLVSPSSSTDGAAQGRAELLPDCRGSGSLPRAISPLGDQVLFPALESLVIDYTRCTPAPGALEKCRNHTGGELCQGWMNAQQILDVCRPKHLCIKGGYGHGSPTDHSPESVTIHPGLDTAYGLPWLSVGKVNTFVLAAPDSHAFCPPVTISRQYLAQIIAGWLKYFQMAFPGSPGTEPPRWRVGQLDSGLVDQGMRKYHGTFDDPLVDGDPLGEPCIDQIRAELDEKIATEIFEQVVELYPSGRENLEILTLAQTAALSCPACGQRVTEC